MTPATKVRESWDLFCRVVDNFGDIGIAWRLAKQLADDGTRRVRLFVDDLSTFARIEPRVAAERSRQSIAGIAIERWPVADDPEQRVGLANVVVEVLGCGLPPWYLDAMARNLPDPVWIDLEHLTAESWIDGFHGLPSPHPTLPLVKHFFYPGFGPASGGLLVERDLEERRRAFVDDPDAVDAFFARLDATSRPKARVRIRRLSLFAYRDAPVAALFDALAADASRDSTVLVPEGVLAAPVASWFGTDGTVRTRGALTVTTIPFLDQDDYDRLLWGCDANFVRGEESFVRAQAAGRPLVWHIYPQADGVDARKRAAFEVRYEASFPDTIGGAQRAFQAAWNDRDGSAAQAATAQAASRWLADLPALTDAAETWRDGLLAQTPLVERLAAFVARVRTARRSSS